ncbi:cytochrome P450 [Amylocarpus encephaloides]|uniref:Cytochrome P450 n=1 Tax=Amylocarpus encephaloides TaxID=45428 RepID=A0A9P8C8S8_9HELO|nr:cytochrome P450 [Amylocarpus encephaloides]
MYPSNDTILPSITAAVGTKNHDGSMIMPTFLAAMLAAGAIVAFSRIGSGRGCEGKEPPVLASKIPLIGHLIGMLRWQVGYMQMLSRTCPTWPAFTLRIFSSRVYVICDPSLIQAAYRNARTFDFGSFVVESSERLFNISQEGMKIIRGETAPEYDPNGPFLNGNRGKSFLNDDHKLIVDSLSPGPALLDLSQSVLERVAGSLNNIDNRNDGKFGLYRWMRDTITVASAEAIYGPNNPFSGNQVLVDDLWHFEKDMTLLMLRFLPTFIAPKAYHARIAIRDAFKNYYAQGHDKDASALIQSHLASCKKWGFNDDDIANFEVSTLFLATTNTVSTSFWVLSHIQSDPSLLATIRSEVTHIVKRRRANGQDTATMDTTLIQTKCPLLLATFHETLRFVGAATSVRSVIEPATLKSSSTNTSFSLQSPAVIQLPSGITHSSPAIWGPDADTFNPVRFLPSTVAALDRDTKRKQTQGYFPFGGGKHLCPGRHFATTEVLSFVAAIVCGFDVEGSYVPERAFQKLGTGVRKPVCDVDVGMRRRRGWEGVSWSFNADGEKEVYFGAQAGGSDELDE